MMPIRQSSVVGGQLLTAEVRKTEVRRVSYTAGTSQNPHATRYLAELRQILTDDLARQYFEGGV